MKRYELEILNKDALREHAEVSGIECGPDDTKGQLIDRILGEIPPFKTETDAMPTRKMQKDAPDIPLRGLYDLAGNPIPGKNVKLTIFATESDKSDVDLVVNGYNVRVQRGKEVLIHEAFVKGPLKDAVIDTYVQDQDTGERVQQQIMIYPHTIAP